MQFDYQHRMSADVEEIVVQRHTINLENLRQMSATRRWTGFISASAAVIRDRFDRPLGCTKGVCGQFFRSGSKVRPGEPQTGSGTM